MDSFDGRVPLHPFRRLNVDKDMPLAVANGYKLQQRRSDSELAIFFRRLDVAKGVEGCHMIPGGRTDWLPDHCIHIMAYGEVGVEVLGSGRCEDNLSTTKAKLEGRTFE